MEDAVAEGLKHDVRGHQIDNHPECNRSELFGPRHDVVCCRLTFASSGRAIASTEAMVIHGPLERVARSHRIHRSSATRLQARAVARAATPVADSNTPTPRTPPVQETRATIRGRDTPRTARDSSPPRFSPGGSR